MIVEELNKPVNCIISSIFPPTPQDNQQNYYEEICGLIDTGMLLLAEDGNMWLRLVDTYQYRDDGIYNFQGLLGFPFRIINYLLDKQYIIKNTIIWNKINMSVNYIRQRCPVDYDLIVLIAKSGSSYFHNQFEKRSEYITYKRKKTKGDGDTIIERPINETDRLQLEKLKERFIKDISFFVKGKEQELDLKFGSEWKNWFSMDYLDLPSTKEWIKLMEILDIQVDDFLHDNVILNASHKYKEIFIRTGRSKRTVWDIAPVDNKIMPKEIIQDMIFMTCPSQGLVGDLFGYDVDTIQQVCANNYREYVNLVFRKDSNLEKVLI